MKISVAVAVIAFSVSGCSTLTGTLDIKMADLEQSIRDQLGVAVTVSCPSDIPLGTGNITDCTVTDGVDRKYLRITQDDANGHYTWEITSQDAP